MRTYSSISNRNSTCFTNEITSKINSYNRWIILFNKASRAKNKRGLSFYFTSSFIFILNVLSQLQLLITSPKTGTGIIAVPVNTSEEKNNQYIQTIILQIRSLKKSICQENNLKSYNLIKGSFFTVAIAVESFAHHPSLIKTFLRNQGSCYYVYNIAGAI